MFIIHIELRPFKLKYNSFSLQVFKDIIYQNYETISSAFYFDTRIPED
jgi:hypothetical protein